MVAIVAGNSLGLSLTSLATLGQKGMFGSGESGRSGQQAYVNATTGNLVLQAADDRLVARGGGTVALRTYNSQGRLSDDNGDNWSMGMYARQLALTGTAGANGSSIVRTDRDGAEAVYGWDASKGLYTSTSGGGAYDTIAYASATSRFEWTDGATGLKESYEATGAMRLLSTADTAGNTTVYAYDTAGLLASVTTASGETTFYDYIGANLSQIRTSARDANDVLQVQTAVRYTYDSSNRLSTVTVDLSPADNSVADGKVYRTSYTYDGSSTRVASISETDGTRLVIGYVLSGGVYRVASVTDALGQTTSYSYSGTAPMLTTTVTSAGGKVSVYVSDAAGRLVEVREGAAGVTLSTRYSYNANDDVASITDGEGRVTTFGYDARGNLTLQRDALGNTVSRTYDAQNQLVTETVYLVPDPDGAGALQPGAPLTTRYVYDAAGRNQLRFMLTPEGRVTEYTYNAYGERTSSIQYLAAMYGVAALPADTAPSESALQAWAAGQDRSRVARTDLAYDARGQLLSSTTWNAVDATGAGIADGAQSVNRYVYDQGGLLLKSIAASGGVTLYAYDGLDRQIAATNALGELTTTQYDDANRQSRVTQANGLVTTSTHDAAGRLISVQQFNAANLMLGETRYYYDANNQLRATVDPTGAAQWVFYDTNGRKVADIDASGSLVEYFYDKSNLLTKTRAYVEAVTMSALLNVTVPNLGVTLETIRPAESARDRVDLRNYDGAGRLVRTMDAVGAVTAYTYDGASRLVQAARYATPAPIGSATIPTVAKSDDDRIVRNFYDGDGRQIGTLDAEGYLTEQKYDAAGRLVESIRYAAPTPPAARPAGELRDLRPAADAGDIRAYTLYDARGLAIAQIDGERYLTERVYDASGNVTQTIRYATKVAAGFAPGAGVASLRPASSTADQVTRQTYDLLGRVTQQTDSQGTVTTYTYDTRGNLVSTVKALGTEGARTLAARYDLQGRLVGELSAEGAALLTGGQTQAQIDAIWATRGITHAYDAAGRRMSTTDALGNRTLFFYTADGLLSRIVNALGEVEERRYDGLDQLTDVVRYGTRLAPSVLAALTGSLAGGIVNTVLLGAVNALSTGTNAALNSITRYTYTAAGQVASVVDALGGLTTTEYNSFGDEKSRLQTGASAAPLIEAFTVDKRGLRTGTVRDPLGVTAVETASYDAFGRATRIVDANGNATGYTYDRLGRTVAVTDPTGAVRRSSYDAFDRVLTQTDALGHVTAYAYDAAARSLTVTTPEGIATVTTYTRHGQVQSIADGKGQVTTYTYDRNGNLKQTTTPLTTSGSAYDAADRLIETTDAAGNKVAYAYDAAGRVLTRRIDPAGLNLTTTYAYDALGRQVSVTDANGVVTSTQFDLKGQMTRVTVDPAGLNLQTAYAWDGRGRMLSVTSPGGTLTQYVYDALGRRVGERIDPGGLKLSRTYAYDKAGNVTGVTDPNGNLTRYAYDQAGRLVFTLDALGNVQQNKYDGEGRLIKTATYARPLSLTLPTALTAAPTVDAIEARVVADPATDLVQHRVYDNDGRLAFTVDGTGAVVKFVYDANGNVVERVAFASRIDLAAWTAGTPPVPTADAGRDMRVRTVYDALNRAVYTIDGVGAVTQNTYDGNGRLLKRVAYATCVPPATAATDSALAAAAAAVADEARDACERRTYDAAGRLTFTVDGAGALTQRTFDGNGNVLRELRYATAISGTAVPSVALASSLAGPNDRSTAWTYDAAGRTATETNALDTVTRFTYDKNGNLVLRSTLDRAIRFAYDAAGRQVFVLDAENGLVETIYDDAGQAIATTAYAKTLSGAPDGVLLLETLRPLAAAAANENADRTAKRVFDAAGRQVWHMDAEGAVTRTSYDGVGRVTATWAYAKPIGTTTANNAIAAAAAANASAGADRITSFSYNAAGQLTATTDALNATERYTYDALGNKTSFTNKKGAVWYYGYDAAGRLLTETMPLSALGSVGVDGAGNLVAGSTQVQAVVNRLAYDALGNLIQRTEAEGRPEQRVTQYRYDALGRQVQTLYPAVPVYNAAADNLAANGASALAGRTESVQALQSWTMYDTLGNAVASRDVSGAISQKAYDRLGRVVYDVDALGFVTGYVRNAFGDVTQQTRYGDKTSLANSGVATAAQAVTRATIETALQQASVSHTSDRTLTMRYDRLSRVTEVALPAAFTWDSSAAPGQNATAFTAQITRTTYDAFGQAVKVSRLRNDNANAALRSWLDTYHYFDRSGRETGSIDAMGYLTTRTFDTAGHVTLVTEYARTLAAGSWNLAGWSGPPTLDADDRVTATAWDPLGRKTSETRKNVEVSAASNGTSGRADLTTSYGYDAVGNLTRTTDALGQSTYTYYDVLGRVEAIAEPARVNIGEANVLRPLTVFLRDAHGNVLVRLDHANGATSATEAAYTPGAASSADRSSLARYDAFGRAVQTTDALGHSTYTSYDASGHVAKTWQSVTGSDGSVRTVFEAFSYDKLGRQTLASSPGAAALDGTATPLVTVQTEFNAFGEIVRKGTNGGRQEYFDYDNAGRLWRTNEGDGVDRITLYDALGNATADIRSAGTSNMLAMADASTAAAAAEVRRTDVRYDALGRVTARVAPARVESQGGVAVRQVTYNATVVSRQSMFYQGGIGNYTEGENRLSLSWSSLAVLGSGDVKVVVEYRTPPQSRAARSDDDPQGYLPAANWGGTARVVSREFDASAADTGVQFVWKDTLPTVTTSEPDGGLGTLTRVMVYKKDINGYWQPVMDKGSGAFTNVVDVAMPADASSGLALYLAPAGTQNWSSTVTAVYKFNDAYRFDVSNLPAGNYDYQVQAQTPGAASRVVATGQLTLSAPPLAAISSTPAFGAGTAASVMSWVTPASGTAQIFNYRPAGSNGAWTPGAIQSVGSGRDGFDTASLPPGNYQFELLWSTGGSPAPNAHATGQFTATAATPQVYVPPVGTPPIGGFAASVMPGESVGSPDPNARLQAIEWDMGNYAQTPNLARARLVGTANWINLTIIGYPSSWDSEGRILAGKQKVSVESLAAGNYELEVLKMGGSAVLQRGTATFALTKSVGQWVTQPVTVVTQVPRVIFYQPVYETRWAFYDTVDPIWVAYFTGTYDEASNPIFGYQLQYVVNRHWYSYQVQVGQTPVYQRDDYYNIVYDDVYHTEMRPVWVPGGAANPVSITTTTPPYTPGYTIPATPARYTISLGAAQGTAALSTGPTGLAATKSLDGITSQARPTVLQNTDRWGNVTSISDPRSAAWVTTYRFNANNQMVQQVQPGGVTSQVYFDALGRQVAVRDALGNVSGRVWDASGRLVQELHADGGTITHRYDALGNETSTTDAMGKLATFSYDRLGRMLTATRGSVAVYNANTGALAYEGVKTIIQRYTWDELGRRVSETDGREGAAGITSYMFDLRGNAIAITRPGGVVTRAAFDTQGRKIAELDAGGALATWRYDHFGLLTARTDIGGATYSYAYDAARQLTATANSRGMSLLYGYDTAGQLTVIHDAALGKVTRYTYDAAGNHIREQTTQGGVTYQDNHLAYDALGRLRDVADGRVHIALDYDAAGNRTRINTHVMTGDTSQDKDRWFVYDSMNRQIVVDGINAAGDIAAGQGHKLTYDKNGNRTSDITYGNRIITSPKMELYAYDESGMPLYRDQGNLTYTKVANVPTAEVYSYDDLNRLTHVVRDGVDLDTRLYDGAGRVVRSGAVNVPAGYAAVLNEGVPQAQRNGMDQRLNTYDAQGRLVHQKSLNTDGTANFDTDYTQFDAAGNVLAYNTSVHGPSGYQNSYTTQVGKFEDYKETLTTGTSTKFQGGSTRTNYDVNGQLQTIVDSAQVNNNRSFVNDAAGQALYVNQAGNVRRQLIVNGEVLGSFGVGVDRLNPTNPNDRLQNPNFAQFAEFDNFGFQRVTANYPNAAPGVYTVRSGDTLKSIARSAYGDSNLWYLIAQANGLADDGGLRVGQSINIPSTVGGASNTGSTFKPYDPSQIKGDTSPTLPMPQAEKGGCGGLGQIIMIVVAVVVTIYTAGALSGVTSSFGATMSAGATAMTSSAGIAAASAAVGSVVSQAVGMVAGVQDDFNWKGVALSALGGGISAELSGINITGGAMASTGNVIARAALGNALGQGVGVVTGLQKAFDWRGVAASAVGAGVGQTVGAMLNNAWGGTPVGDFATRAVTGLAAGTAAAVMRGGRVSIQQVATDAFGNALAEGLASRSPSQGNGPYSAGDYVNEMDEQSDSYWLNSAAEKASRTARWDGEDPPSKASQYQETFGGEIKNTTDRVRLSRLNGDSRAETNIINATQADRLTELQRTQSELNAIADEMGDINEQTLPLVTIRDRRLTQAEKDEFDRMNPGLADAALAAEQTPSRDGNFARNFLRGLSGNQDWSVFEGTMPLAYSAGSMTRTGLGLVYDSLTGAGDFRDARSAWNKGDVTAASMYGVRGVATAGLTAMTLGDFALAKAGIVGGVAGKSALSSFKTNDLAWQSTVKLAQARNALIEETQTRSASLNLKYDAMSPSVRLIRMNDLAEANAYRRLQQLEASIPGAHFGEKHGAQTLLESQRQRVLTGRNPTTGVIETYPNGNPKLPSAATRFLSHRDEINAIERAQRIYDRTGQVSLAQTPIEFRYPIGEGFKRNPFSYGQSYSAQVFFNSGRVVTAFPKWSN